MNNESNVSELSGDTIRARRKRAQRKAKRCRPNRQARFESLESRSLLAAYLMIDEIPGDSTSKVHTNEIPVEGFSWGISITEPGTTNSRTHVSDFRVTALPGKASPRLMRDAVLGPRYDETKLSLTRNLDGEEVDFLTVDFSNAAVTNFGLSGEADPSRVGYSDLGLTFSEAKFEYRAVDPDDGSLGSANEISWDLLNDKTSGIPIQSETDEIGTLDFLTIGKAKIGVDSFAWSLGSPAPQGGSNGRADVFPSDISFSRRFDLASVGLLSAATSQTSLGESITFSGHSEFGQSKFLTSEFTLYDPYISSYSLGGHSDDIRNAFSLRYSKVEYEHSKYDTDGKLVSNSFASWDRKFPGEVQSKGVLDSKSSDRSPGLFLELPNGGEIPLENTNWGSFISVDSQTNKTFGSVASLSSAATLDDHAPFLIGALAEEAGQNYTVRENTLIDSKVVTTTEWKLEDAFVESYSMSLPGEVTDFRIAFGKVEYSQTVFNESFDSIGTSNVQFDLNKQTGSSNNLLNSKFPSVSSEFGMTLYRGDAQVEVPIDSIQWSVQNQGEAIESGAFFVDSLFGHHSAAVLDSSLSGQLFDKVSLIRRNSNSDEVYRWDLEDVVADGYSRAAASGSRPDESFSLRPGLITLTTTHSNKSTSTVQLNPLSDKLTSNNLQPIGLGTFADGNFTYVEYPDDSHSDFEFFGWNATLPLGQRQSDGTRPVVGTPRVSSPLSIVSAPSTGMLWEVLNNKSTQGPIEVSDSIGNFLNGDFVRLTEFGFSQNADFDTYLFSDQINGQPLTNLELTYENLEATFNRFGENGKTEPGTAVDWNFSKGIVSTSGEDNGFGGHRFDADKSPPRYILTVNDESKESDGSQMEIEAFYAWTASNAIQQPVGSKALGQRNRGVGTSEMFFLLPRDDSTSGFISAVARGVTIPELRVTARESPLDSTIPTTEWILSEAIPTQVYVDTTRDDRSLVVGFNIGKMELRALNQSNSARSLTTGSEAISQSSSSSMVDDFASAFIDFITPPASSGIDTIVVQNQNPGLTVRLSDYFTDEQEASSSLEYDVTVVSNPTLFSSVSVNGDQLILNLDDTQTGTATLSVTATDSFDLVNTQLVDVVLESGLDFGDAPANYPTLLSADGARHHVTGPRLGELRDAEDDGQPNAAANGDDLSASDDEDGVMFGRVQVGSAMAGVNIDLQNATTARVDAWIDFDGNGIWETDEKILDSALVQEVDGFETLNFEVNDDAIAGEVSARVRVSGAGGLLPIGEATDGEVEDYQVTILPTTEVESIQIGSGGPSRSQVTSLDVQFNTLIDHQALESAFRLQHLGSDTSVGSILVQSVDADGKTNARLTFDGDNTISRDGGGELGNSLADGNYQLFLNFQALLGQPGNTDEAIGDVFFRFYGDTDRDRDVDGQDYGRFGLAFLTTIGQPGYDPQLDRDGDGDIDGQDYGAFGLNFLKTLSES